MRASNTPTVEISIMNEWLFGAKKRMGESLKVFVDTFDFFKGVKTVFSKSLIHVRF
jgi:hypothetical protein